MNKGKRSGPYMSRTIQKILKSYLTKKPRLDGTADLDAAVRSGELTIREAARMTKRKKHRSQVD